MSPVAQLLAQCFDMPRQLRIADAARAGARLVVTGTGESSRAEEATPSQDNMRRCGFARVASRLNFVAPEWN